MKKSRNTLLACVGFALMAGCGGKTQEAPRQTVLMADTVVISNPYRDLVQQLYIAYFGRPAEPGGLQWFSEQLQRNGAPTSLVALDALYDRDPNVRGLVEVFSTSAESQKLYGGDNTAFMRAIYRNILNREPDAGGLAFWSDLLDKGVLTRGRAALSIMASALSNQSSDAARLEAATVLNKTAIASLYTASLSTPELSATYAGIDDAAFARDWLAKVGNTTDVSKFSAPVYPGYAVAGPKTQSSVMLGFSGSGARQRYQVTHNSDGSWQLNESGGTDLLKIAANATTLNFADGTLNLTVADAAKGISDEDQKTLAGLFIAYYDRLPDADGLEYWIKQKGAGQTLAQIADSFQRAAIQYPELSGYSANLSNADFAGKIYRNVFGRIPEKVAAQAPSADELASWRSALDSGKSSRGQMVLDMISAVRKATGRPSSAFQQKQALAQMLAIRQGMNSASAAIALTLNTQLAHAFIEGDGGTAGRGDKLSVTTKNRGIAGSTLDAATGYVFNTDAAVKAEQLAPIQKGIAMAQELLDAELGGGVPAAIRALTQVRVAASGNGNQESGGGGSCCTGLAEASSTFTVEGNAPAQMLARMSVLRPYFDVLHPQWLQQNDIEHTRVAAHEYVHGWQSHLGCISLYDQPLGMWMNEGIAEYLGNEVIIRAKLMSRSDVQAAQLSFAKGSGQLTVNLRELGVTSAAYWPGNVGYLAIERLVNQAPAGTKSIRTMCEQVSAGTPVSDAFRTAFGISMDDFYTQFETWRQQQLGR